MLMRILESLANQIWLGGYKTEGQYKNSLPFLYFYTLVFVWQIVLVVFPQSWRTKQGSDPAMKVSVTQAVLRYSQATTACSGWHLASLGGLRRQGRSVS